MTINTSYTCDVCKYKTENKKEIFRATLKICRMNSHHPASIKNADVCLGCVKDRFGLYLQPDASKEQPAPTLEDMILDIVRNAIEERTHD